MDQALTIQQVAQATGLSTHTLRYYERCDLIAPIHRASNGHRRYSAQDIRWIQFLTKLRMTGMPIRQIQQYATLLRQHPDAVQERRALLEAHRQTVVQQLQELQENLTVIDWKIQHYKEIETKLSETPVQTSPQRTL
ncbi:MerR family transcriptional regulator [Leptolyngbyaceae cyanobacterium CCMR0082]|uniref:MerR family transcriptional regulator n=1 Tax=Adonisia turfae CCMR0082 TaxID=2304604 RepID=A0A6M0SFM5_9CYAN|nr:MerR family transcriptional regulator [Adonisia turfae]MDV3349899.1 MerR family transcriptional regulator [Leptothoe sp. LEGE 181152]NEZ66422.1 MerR family transcriptional regulator [Adonisia turfae CCMR0082]